MLIAGCAIACVLIMGAVGYVALGDQPAPDLQGQTQSQVADVEKNAQPPSDYDRLQGTWRFERINPVTDTVYEVEEIIFRNKLYVKRSKGKEGWAETDAAPFELTTTTTPKRLDLLGSTTLQQAQAFVRYQSENSPGGRRPGSLPPVDQRRRHLMTFYNRTLCTFELEGDRLMIRYGGTVYYQMDPQGNVSIDKDDPKAVYPSEENSTVRVYHRVKLPENPRQRAERESARRNQLLDEQIKAADEAVRLRLAAYQAGKETVDFMLGSIAERKACKLARQGADQKKKLAIVQEALDALKSIEGIASERYRAGSATLLEVRTIQVKRIGCELELIEMEMPMTGR